MRTMVLAALFLSLTGLQAQETPKTFEHEDECGNPVIESMAWAIP